jgi:glycosyltransferase involved in cell wall biosynthesis
MKIGVNGWRINGRRTGVGRYLLNVVGGWTPERVGGRVDEINLYSPVPLDDDIELPPGVATRVVGPPWRMLAWENLRLGPTAADDVVFHPSYTRPLIARGKTVVATHDATIHLHPELYPGRSRALYDWHYGWSARHATRVICATETVRRHVAEAWDVPLSKIHVVGLGTDDHIRPMPDGDPQVAEVRTRYLGTDDPFFLFVGKRSVRRNVPLLIEAFAELKRREAIDHKLLIVGLNTQGLDVAALAARHGATEHVYHVDYVSESDLVALYNAADVFVMPSVFEMLSLPIMECQAVGTPVITIDTPGLREMTAGAAYLMPKAGLPDIVLAMSKLAKERSLRSELSEAGFAVAATRSWERCAMETLDVLEEAARA